MLPVKSFKTVRQYSRFPISDEDMKKLLEIARDYCSVKNYVYRQYSGIKSLSKIYPGYTVQNEMTKSGLRDRLGLPSVYFYLAVFDALGDIKTQWTRIKNGILDAINKNQRFTAEDRHYLRFVIKVGGYFESILNGRAYSAPETMIEQYNAIAGSVDAENLNRYICRQVRKRVKSLYTEKADGFSVAERAYRYGYNGSMHGIFITSKEKRKRIFIPLTDENEYDKQLYVRLKTEESSIEIDVPIEVNVRRHADYKNEVGLSAGIWHMFTTDCGNVYGEDFGKLHEKIAELISIGEHTYRREKENNPGRKKYFNRKRRLDAGLEAYVNMEINRMLENEKPKKIYIPKLPKNSKAGINGRINYSVNVWRKGFIRKRLEQKCIENGVEIIEVFGKGISMECSSCGALGAYVKDMFFCGQCGFCEDKKVNAARNALKRGQNY